jgi:hypothetical protein
MTERVKINCDDCKFVEDCVDYGWYGCKKFTPAPSEPQTNEEMLRGCTFEEMAGAIYEWYSQGHIEGKVGKQLSSVTRVVEWLKEKHNGNI